MMMFLSSPFVLVSRPTNPFFFPPKTAVLEGMRSHHERIWETHLRTDVVFLEGQHQGRYLCFELKEAFFSFPRMVESYDGIFIFSFEANGSVCDREKYM